jgi:hypothetical protein
MSVFIPVSYCFCYYGSVLCFEIGYYETSSLAFVVIGAVVQGI